jgi:FKBP-type peptidyl-prolyl cis-trans isomerase 2
MQAGPIEPGMVVRHPQRPEWGRGQVQSVVGDRITVNFEDAGKVLINGAVVALEIQHPGTGGR